MNIGILAIHGMGTDPHKYNRYLKKALRGMNVTIEAVDYHQYTQHNQDDFKKRMAGSNLGWGLLRRYVVDYLSDALNILRRPREAGGMYESMNKSIDDAYVKLTKQLAPTDKVIVVAHSLGAAVFCGYLYDHANNDTPMRKIGLPFIDAIITTGSPIPLFFSCLPEKEIQLPLLIKRDIKKWYNFYDRNDILAFPLKPLSKDFDDLVEDIEISIGNTPLAHSLYWMHDKFQRYLQMIVKDLGGTNEH